MRIEFPSPEFDDAVAAVCHGTVLDEQARALNELLREHAGARDEYILRLELHSRLASELDLFVPVTAAHESGSAGGGILSFPNQGARRGAHHTPAKRKRIWITGLAAGLALVAGIDWTVRSLRPDSPRDIAPAPVVTEAGDWKPSVTNLPGQVYPRINSERRAQFRIHAPNASQVSINIASSNMGSPLTIAKSDDGVWTITTSSLGVGFHFYRVLIDGVSVADPATQIFRGGGGDWRSSAIEVPTGEDFHEVKNVPHGEVREQRYFSPTTGESRRIFVYTPPEYQRETWSRYPVLYLLPGGGEDETCWPAQGRIAHIMDNLIAAQQARPTIVVMEAGVARKPGESDNPLRAASADSGQRYMTLEEVFLNELIPTIDQTYRTLTDSKHRALAGVSVGGMQAFAIGLRRPEHFGYIGGFSGAGSIQNRSPDSLLTLGGVMAGGAAVNRSMQLLFISLGRDEPERMLNSVKQYRDALQTAGIPHVFYQSPDTGHEWHTWRRSLREFAVLLFKD